jgi:hypothetical protein
MPLLAVLSANRRSDSADDEPVVSAAVPGGQVRRIPPPELKPLPLVESESRQAQIHRELRWEAIEKRLEALGATDIRVNEIGSEGGIYHVRCVMPIPGNGIYNRPFDATDPDPARAMQRMLRQIESWATAVRPRKKGHPGLRR